MRYIKTLLALGLGAPVCIVLAADTSVPPLINFQGRLNNSAGQPLTGALNLSFTF